MEDKNKFNEDGTMKPGWKDLVAIMIAQFQILMPLAIGAIVIMTLLMLFLVNVWMK